MQAATGLIANMSRVSPALVVLCAGYLAACSGEAPTVNDTEVAPTTESANVVVKLLEPPAGSGAMAPQLTAGPAGTLLTWLQPVDAEQSEGAPQAVADKTMRLMAVELSQDGGTWNTPHQIVEGNEFFANWADLPAAVEVSGGVRFAHWLEKLGDDTYAYGVQVARSTRGESWERLGLLHDDASPTEHGFVSYVPLAEDVQAFWLDGRAMAGGDGGSMQLRTTRLGNGSPQPSAVLDERVCECCQTDAALTHAGPIVVYRDRDATEIRDIAVVRGTSSGWTDPAILHADRWQIAGCPVNGPAVAADGTEVAVAWFTAASETARVLVAFSSDSGASFGAPIEVDGDKPVGRVDIVLDGTGRAYVSWLGTKGEAAEIRLRRVSPPGELGEVRRVAATTVGRSAGMPRMVRHGDELLLTWVEDAEPSRIMAGLVPLG